MQECRNASLENGGPKYRGENAGLEYEGPTVFFSAEKYSLSNC